MSPHCLDSIGPLTFDKSPPALALGILQPSAARRQASLPNSFLWHLIPSRNLDNKVPPKLLGHPLLCLYPSSFSYFTSPVRPGPGHSSLCLQAQHKAERELHWKPLSGMNYSITPERQL